METPATGLVCDGLAERHDPCRPTGADAPESRSWGRIALCRRCSRSYYFISKIGISRHYYS